MEVLKFTLEGQCAFFKVPNMNLNYLTYSHIPKPTLLGLLGAICGYNGYRKLDEDDVIPQYLTKFKYLEVAIVPSKFNFIKSFYKFNNSSGCATNTKKVANLITSFQILENVSWDIYIKNNNTESYNYLKENLLNNTSMYIPYLGNNSFGADIKNVQISSGEEVLDSNFKCISLIKTEVLEHKELNMLDKLMSRSKEYNFNLPSDMNESSMYIYSKFTFTNNIVNVKEGYKNKFLNVDSNIVYFY